MSPKTYAILYLRPDGWWIAGEGWESYRAARQAADDHFDGESDWCGWRKYGENYKVCVVGARPYRKAKELEEREAL